MKDINEILKVINKLMGKNSSVDIDINSPEIAAIAADMLKPKARLELSKNHQIGMDVPLPDSGNTVIHLYKIGIPTSSTSNKSHNVSEPKRAPVVRKEQHSYVPPVIAKEMVSVLVDMVPHNIWLAGPTQCGKTSLVRYVCGQLGRKVYQINCRGDMGSEAFFGQQTVSIDPDTKQNHITFQKGVVEQAMVEGLDANGQEVGEAAILFIDEAPSCPAHIAHGINRLLETDDARRSMVIHEDGGRVVRSHSKFRIVLAGNTIGRGAVSTEDSAYAAQVDALDISLLNRVAVTFRMGYDRNVEKHILAEKVGDDKVAALILKFRDAIRGYIKSGQLSTPFSTKRIIDIANMYRVFGDIGKAVFFSTFEQLLPEEKPVYNEQAVAVLGKDLMKEYVDANIDY
jgi:MoxR-like ATPase